MRYAEFLSRVSNNDPSILELEIILSRNLIEILFNNEKIDIPTKEDFREFSDIMGKNHCIAAVTIKKEVSLDLSHDQEMTNYIKFIRFCRDRNILIKEKKDNIFLKSVKYFFNKYMFNPIKASVVFVDEGIFESILGPALNIISFGFLYDVLRNVGPRNLRYHMSLPVVSIDNSLGSSEFYESIKKSSVTIGFQDFDGEILSLLGVPSKYLCKILGQAIGFCVGLAIAVGMFIPASVCSIIDKIALHWNNNKEIAKIESEINKIDMRSENEKQQQKSSRKAFVSSSNQALR